MASWGTYGWRNENALVFPTTTLNVSYALHFQIFFKMTYLNYFSNECIQTKIIYQMRNEPFEDLKKYTTLFRFIGGHLLGQIDEIDIF